MHGVHQQIQPAGGHGAERDESIRVPQFLGELPDGSFRSGVQIVFADSQDPVGSLGGKGEYVLIHSRRRLTAVHHGDHQIGSLCRLAAALYAQLLHGVGGIVDTGGVNEPQEGAAAGNGLLHRVPRGAGDVGDDGPVIASQGVEQGGLTGIGQAHDSSADAVFQHPAPLGGVQQGGEGVGGDLQRRSDLLRLNVLNVLVGVIHHGVKPGGDVDEGLLHRRQAAAETAVQLGCGVFRGSGGLGIDEIDDGFRLRQVHFAVEEGPLGEFTGLGLPGSGGKESGEQGVEDYGRAVAVEFGGVLPSVAVSAAEADG